MAQRVTLGDWHLVFKILIPLAYALLEYKLGKTNTGSVLGALIKVIPKGTQKDSIMGTMNQELKEVLKTIFDAGKLTQMAIKDKGFATEEEPLAMQIFMEAPKAFGEMKKAIDQAKNLTAEGEADLTSFVISELGVADQRSANIIIKGFQLGYAGYQFEQALVKGPVATAT